jgi:cytochrome b6-f complex iron-sulfur subunit
MSKSSVERRTCANHAVSGDDRGGYTISRRSFLGGSAAVVLPVLCGGCSDRPGPPIVDLPPVANKQIALPLSSFSDLMSVGGSLVGKASGYADPIVIAHIDQGTFVALDAICTHQNCTVSYNALNITLDCPCHGSTYEARDGSVINGPAVLPLTRLTASSDGTTVTITLR